MQDSPDPAVRPRRSWDDADDEPTPRRGLGFADDEDLPRHALGFLDDADDDHDDEPDDHVAARRWDDEGRAGEGAAPEDTAAGARWPYPGDADAAARPQHAAEGWADDADGPDDTGEVDGTDDTSEVDGTDDTADADLHDDRPRRDAEPAPDDDLGPVDDLDDDLDDDVRPARGLGFLDDPDEFDTPDGVGPDDDHPEPTPYAWEPPTAAVWADVWASAHAAEDAYAPGREPAATAAPVTPEPAYARPRRRGRLSRTGVAVVGTAAALIVAVPVAVAAVRDDPAQAVAAPALPLAPAPAATPTPTPLPEPTVEAPPAPIVQPPATLSGPPEPRPVTGIPRPCSVDLPFPATGSLSDTVDRMERQWGLRLTGSQWRDERYRPVVRIFSETMDAVDCTDYLARVKAGNGGSLEVSSGSTGSWAWGDYGLTRPGVLTLDFTKFLQGYQAGDRGRLVRLVIHEMAHSLNSDRDSEPAYWRTFHGVWAANGKPTAYGSNETEGFADAVGYYVARCAADNPYADPKKSAYYDYVKTHIFRGREFGGPVGTPQVCDGEGR